MSRNVMNGVQRDIKERTVDMSSEEYVAFMRELAEWAETQAQLAEYSDDYYQNFDND